MTPRLGLSVRTRWAVLFGGLFLLAGAGLLLTNYVLVNEIVPQAGVFVSELTPPPKVDALPDGSVMVSQQGPITNAVTSFRSSTMQTLLIVSGLALVIAGAAAMLIGWWIAGRALRPVHKITAAARRLGAESLDRRINLDGPDDELKELADTFDSMLDRLASAFDSQRRFIANASHELRTPLAVQRTLIEVAMADPTASPELLRLGQHLLHTNERSERMIEGLLVLARSDRGLVSRLPVRLDGVVEDVLRLSTGLAAEEGVTVASQLAPRVVVGDKVLLERLVTNLVQNALRYNESGGSVLVAVGEWPALMVSNTGPVVPAESVPALFEPFRRLDRERTRSNNGASAGGSTSARRDGAGLGLSIVRSIVTAHGGTVHAEALTDGGLRVTVYLPPVARNVTLVSPRAGADRVISRS